MAAYLPPNSVDHEDGDFSGLTALSITNLAGKSFARSILYWANLEGSDLSNCNFEQVDFRGSNLKNCNFSHANLKGANFGRDNVGGATRLQGADLRSAEISNANFSFAEYDENTQFPNNFSPTRHKMSHVV